jgi:lipopolysaccharide biosynthesis protein
MRRYTVAGAFRRIGRYQIKFGQWMTGSAPLKGDPFVAGFVNWLERYNPRQPATYPDAWREKPETLSLEQPQKVAVVMHVFYTELVDELIEQLAFIPVDFDLIITNASDQQIEIDRSRLPHARSVFVLPTPNLGRDIFPLVSVVNSGLLRDAELVLKVHTKASPWRESHEDLAGSGGEWRASFLAQLLGSEQNVREILGAFAEDRRLGAITSDGNVLGPEFWGGDEAIARALLRRLEMRLDPTTLRFPAGSMYWIRAFSLQGLRALSLTAADFEPESGQVDGTTAHAIERLVGILTEEAGLTLGERSAMALPAGDSSWTRFSAEHEALALCRAIPFYLPQFHAFEQNDRWWGPGFTEWTNVASGKPVFAGHRQPLLPSELGFYDLSHDDIRVKQAELAREHGIAGLMYYYYWFAGKRVMSMPLERLVASSLDQPFCIMWANENWTRRWDGREKDVIIGQDYDKVPAEDFIDDVLPLLADHRYMRVNGRAILAVYRITQMPDYAEVIETWRERARAAGIGELHLLSVDVGEVFDGLDRSSGDTVVDGHLAFPPHNLFWGWMQFKGLDVNHRFQGHLLSYKQMVEDAEKRAASLEEDTSFYPGVMMNFDNTARRQWNPDIWWGSNPYTFRRWVAAVVDGLQSRPEDERLLFINAWNEWAEGTVLEPSTQFGRSYLQAVRSAILE